MERCARRNTQERDDVRMSHMFPQDDLLVRLLGAVENWEWQGEKDTSVPRYSASPRYEQ